MRATAAEVNGQVGIVLTSAEHAVLAMALDFADGRVAAVRIIVNPDKLAYLAAQLGLRPLEPALLATLLAARSVRAAM